MAESRQQTAPPPLPPFPPPDPRNPFETFLLIWTAIAASGFTTGDPGSELLKNILPTKAVVLWGAAAMIGSIAALVGMTIQRWSNDGLVLERTGVLLVGGAAAIYGYVCQHNAHDFSDVRYVVSVQYGLAMAALWRAWHITKRLRWARSVRSIGPE